MSRGVVDHKAKQRRLLPKLPGPESLLRLAAWCFRWSRGRESIRCCNCLAASLLSEAKLSSANLVALTRDMDGTYRQVQQQIEYAQHWARQGNAAELKEALEKAIRLDCRVVDVMGKASGSQVVEPACPQKVSAHQPVVETRRISVMVKALSLRFWLVLVLLIALHSLVVVPDLVPDLVWQLQGLYGKISVVAGSGEQIDEPQGSVVANPGQSSDHPASKHAVPDSGSKKSEPPDPAPVQPPPKRDESDGKSGLNPSRAMAYLASSLGVAATERAQADEHRLIHGKTGIIFVWIGPGVFRMGSDDYDGRLEQPVHNVRITRPFWVSETEVTREQWRRLTAEAPSLPFDMGDSKSLQANHQLTKEQHPVTDVSWEDAVAFCEKMSESRRATVDFNGAKYGFRLPTEAEWEYCCRAGTHRRFHTELALTDQDANCRGYTSPSVLELAKLDSSFNGGTKPVKSYRANQWGLFDMHGNVREWCLDAWDRTPNYPSKEALNPYQGSGYLRILRGGGWQSSAGECGSALRDGAYDSRRLSDVGFRVVLAPVQKR